MPRDRRQRFTLDAPQLMLVTDRALLRGRTLAGVVRAAVEGGVTIIQLRDKSASHKELVHEGKPVRDAVAGRALFFVNGDVDAALAIGAEGVHIPEAGVPVADVRARVGERLLISRAVHSLPAALAAQRAGADLLQAGTVFATASKPGVQLLGLDGLREICDAVRIPVIAIGGITANNAPAAYDAGASGVAVIGAIFDAPEPQAGAAQLRSALAARRAAAR